MKATRSQRLVLYGLVLILLAIQAGCQAAGGTAAATLIPETVTATTASSLPTETAANGPAAVRLLLLHTNDVLGYLDPCG